MLEFLFVAGMGAMLYQTQKVHPNTGYWIGFACILFSFLLFNCLMWCQWSKMKVAIAVIDATADFMVATKRISLVTIIYFFVGVIVLIIWGFGAIGVISINKIDKTMVNGQT